MIVKSWVEQKIEGDLFSHSTMRPTTYVQILQQIQPYSLVQFDLEPLLNPNINPDTLSTIAGYKKCKFLIRTTFPQDKPLLFDPQTTSIHYRIYSMNKYIRQAYWKEVAHPSQALYHLSNFKGKKALQFPIFKGVNDSIFDAQDITNALKVFDLDVPVYYEAQEIEPSQQYLSMFKNIRKLK